MRDAPATTCYICGSSGRIIHEGLRDRLFGVPGQWNIRACNNSECRLVWIDPQPLEDDLYQAYASYYTHSTDQPAVVNTSAQILRNSFLRLLKRFWLHVLLLGPMRRQIENMYLEGIAPGRLLEVGCGGGKFLKTAHDLGWVVEGQDTDERAAGAARSTYGFTIHSGNLEQLSLPSGTYDAIVMNHVLEHIVDCLAVLRECRRLLKQGGILVATTPNPESYGHRTFSKDWMHLDPPRHIRLFPSPALAKVAQLSGFAQFETHTTPARAAMILAGSLDLRRKGNHRMGSTLLPTQLIATIWHQISARIEYFFDHGSGEEIVLQAWK